MATSILTSKNWVENVSSYSYSLPWSIKLVSFVTLKNFRVNETLVNPADVFRAILIASDSTGEAFITAEKQQIKQEINL